MTYKSPAKFRSFDEFRTAIQAIDGAFDADRELAGSAGALAEPFEWDGRTIGNRFVTHPMEGWDGTSDGRPTELTLRRWHAFGRSGAKLIWGGEAFAVEANGRANPKQLYLNDDADIAGGLDSLLASLAAGHRDLGQDPRQLVVGLQLTHSGRFSRPESALAPRVPEVNPVLTAKFGTAQQEQVLTDAELDGIGERYVAAAVLAQRVGFDFVDVKCCHGYLLHEMLGARSRQGVYGGSFENRTRFFRRVVGGIRAACPGLGIAVRVSIADVSPYVANPQTRIGEPAIDAASLPYRHAFGVSADEPHHPDLAESFAFLRLLDELDITLVNITLGSPYYCPHLQRPAAYPPSDGYLPPVDPLASVFEHLRIVRECKWAFPQLKLIGSGYSYLQDYLPHVAQYEVRRGHVDAVGLGRMLLVYPDMIDDVLNGRELARKRICRTFSDCTTAPRNGLVSGCYPLDPFYKARPEAAELKAIKRGMRRG